jgi:DNA invertase Pin-like site-specific DNA recombinase
MLFGALTKQQAPISTEKAGKIKELVVWWLDRFGRTTGETIILLDRLESLGFKFVSIRMWQRR